MTEIKFPRDTSFRNLLFTADSFAHPAKMDAQLLIWIVERYTKVGETILDPMAGSGTTMLACMLGRDCILVELEQKFVGMAKANWEKVKMMPQLGYEMGECQILQGDARNLEGIVDGIITSPPYAETTAIQDFEFMAKQAEDFPERLRQGLVKGHARGARAEKDWLDKTAAGQIESPNNIGNLPYGSIDSVITSPPYQKDTELHGESHEKGREDGCRSRYPYIDSIITSPPYEERHSYPDAERERRAVEKLKAHPDSKIGGIRIHEHESDNPENIGNMRGDTYLSAMLQVYQQCQKVLKPQGLMILVTKNFIRDKKEVKLDEDTIKLCEQAGFQFLERHYRKLTAQSFWRVIYKQKYPDAPVLDKEDILVFRSWHDRRP